MSLNSRIEEWIQLMIVPPGIEDESSLIEQRNLLPPQLQRVF